MALTKAFFNAVNNGNVRQIRMMMKDSLLVDPTFYEFLEMEKTACEIEGLYDKHDGRELIYDQSFWNDDYMNKLMVQIVNNFSHERLDHLKEVVHYLRPVTNNNIHSDPKNQQKTDHRSQSRSSYQEQKRRDQQNGNYRGAQIAAGAVIGAAIGGTVAAVAGVTVAGSAAVGAVVGGVAVTIAVKGGK